MLAVGGTAFADVHCHIQDGSLDAPDELALGVGWGLEVEPSHDAIAGHAFVVLHEVDFSHFLLELPLGVALEEVATCISKHFRPDDDEPVYCGFYDFHWGGLFVEGVISEFSDDVPIQ